ncbi:MAG: OPT/YSL family transporter, partial [Candidatus Eremiobacteraeota bacterium]|nr:OPT/YSL family transporter [Candidatus Eremiobacteraeota bacterium]
DEVLRRSIPGSKLPPLAVGLGIYLPVGTISIVVLGAIVGRIYNGWVKNGRNPEVSRRLGVLIASGLIVGESLFGIIVAALVLLTKKDAPLAVPMFALNEGYQTYLAQGVGFLALIAVLVVLYRWTGRLARG